MGNLVNTVVEQAKRQQETNLRLEAQIARLGAMRPGDVVTIGSAERPEAIGAAVIQHQESSHDFNERFSRNQGF